MLELSNVEVIYSDVILAVKGITLVVPKGSCVTLLGGNGAGKSTTLKSISNLLMTEDGKVTSTCTGDVVCPLANECQHLVPRIYLFVELQHQRRTNPSECHLASDICHCTSQ